MSIKLDLIDMEWGQDGDYIVREGDIGDTAAVTGQAFVQAVEDRIRSSFNDYKLIKKYGADIDRFEGEINNKNTWSAIENAISFSLTLDGFLHTHDFTVTAAPLSNTEIAVRIDFSTSLTDSSVDSKIAVKVVYDLNGKGPFIIR